MTQKFVASPALADASAGERAVSRLADRLAAMAPASPAVAAFDTPRPAPRGWAPAAQPIAAEPMLLRSPQHPARPPQHAPVFDTMRPAPARKRRSRGIVGSVVDSFVSACSFIPYALVALALRLIMARVFFLDGQMRVDGPRVGFNLYGHEASLVLPIQVKTETVFTFLTQYAALPVPGAIAAWLVSYAEFVLPLMLVLGFGTRIAALGLLIMTAMIQIFVLPEALWTAHIYWAALLLVLLTRGPGALSVDHLIRWMTRRKPERAAA